MQFDDAGYILDATVAHFYCVLIKYFVKRFSSICGDCSAGRGGLNQKMLRCRCLFAWLVLVLLNFDSKLVYPPSPRYFSYWCFYAIMNDNCF